MPENSSEVLSGTDQFITIRPAQGGLTLHIRTWPGAESFGDPPFVLLHGLASNCRTWESVAVYLAAAGHRVVTVDQRGHGLSDKPDDGYDFATVTEDLALLLDALALDQPIVAGQSWGGNVVLAFGVNYPRRARGLSFVDGGTIDLQMRPDATWERIAVQLCPPQLAGTPRTHMKQRIRKFHPDWSNAGIEHTLANFEKLPDGTVRPWLSLDRHLQILRALWEQRPAALYAQVQAPVLICAAAEPRNPDRMTVKREQVAAAAAALPNTTVHWFADTDHDIHVHRPQQLAELFLATLRGGIWA